jgi:hypothetical protein
MSELCQHVYVICLKHGDRVSSPVKVGVSAYPKKRLKTLQTACPYPLFLAAVFTCPVAGMGVSVEREFHRQHAKKKTAGEWFDIEPVVAVQTINLMISMGLVVGGMTLDHIDRCRHLVGLDNFGLHLRPPGGVH